MARQDAAAGRGGATVTALAARREETAGLDRDAPGAPAVGVNEVRLVGRLGATSQERILPSGDTVLTFHVVVDRSAAGGAAGRPRRGRPGGGAPAEGVDALACAAWSARARRTVRTLEPGTWIEVEGALRRRFRRGAVPPVSFYEVELAKVRRLR